MRHGWMLTLDRRYRSRSEYFHIFSRVVFDMKISGVLFKGAFSHPLTARKQIRHAPYEAIRNGFVPLWESISGQA